MNKCLENICKRLSPPKSSRRRNAVIEAFAHCEKHLTMDEIYNRTRKIDPKVGYTTVWRTMKLLESSGLAAAQKLGDGQTRYEYSGTRRHHDHLICINCGKVEEFLSPTIETLQFQIASRHGFSITSHKMELYGYCKACKNK